MPSYNVGSCICCNPTCVFECEICDDPLTVVFPSRFAIEMFHNPAEGETDCNICYHDFTGPYDLVPIGEGANCLESHVEYSTPGASPVYPSTSHNQIDSPHDSYDCTSGLGVIYGQFWIMLEWFSYGGGLGCAFNMYTNFSFGQSLNTPFHGSFNTNKVSCDFPGDYSIFYPNSKQDCSGGDVNLAAAINAIVSDHEQLCFNSSSAPPCYSSGGTIEASITAF